MYLGDQYAKSVSVNRGLILIDEAGYAAESKRRAEINAFAKASGVDHTYFMIAPNKETIYSEYLPEWAKPKENINLCFRLSTEADETLIDIFSALSSAKAIYGQPIYLRTDSHWNSLGAWEAYKQMTRAMSKDDPTLNFLTNQDVNIDLTRRGSGGDISAFLFLDSLITDARPVVRENKEISIEISEPENREVSYSGKNTGVNSKSKPTLVTSKNALNTSRVLWIRDSFGIALSRYMAATFEETIQLHWDEVKGNDQYLKRLIEVYQPDLVLFTIAERNYFSHINSSK